MKLSNSGSLIRQARIVFVRAFIILATVAVCLVGIEVLLRSFYSEEQSGYWTGFHPRLGWALVPGDYWSKPLRAVNKIGIHINELGFRGPSLHANRGKKSLVVLGDSFVFAKESNFEETFPQRLQALLDSYIAGGVDVMNAGVQGYGTAQELLLTRELSQEHQIKPDLYLLMFFTNDTLDNLCLSYGDLTPEPIRPCFTLDAAGKPVLTGLPENQPDYQDDTLVSVKQKPQGFRTVSIVRGWAEEWVQTKSELVHVMTFLGLSPRVGRMPGLLNAWYRQKVLHEGMALTSALIAQMQQEIHENGGQLLVSMVPSTFQVYPETYLPILQQSFRDSPPVDLFADDILRPQRLVREMCEKAGVPFQDLLPVFQEHRETALFIPRDGHLTGLGHKLASETLLPFVLQHMPKDRTASAVSQVVGPRSR